MRDFKKYTSVQIRNYIEADGDTKLLNQLRYSKREQKFKIWMDRFDDVIIRSTKVLATKMEYIHWNPVKKALVKRPEEYPRASAGFYASNIPAHIPVLHFTDLI